MGIGRNLTFWVDNRDRILIRKTKLSKTKSFPTQGLNTSCTANLFKWLFLHAEIEFGCHETTVDVLSATLCTSTAVIRTDCNQDTFPGSIDTNKIHVFFFQAPAQKLVLIKQSTHSL